MATLPDTEKTSPRGWLWPFLRPLYPTFREVGVMSFCINVLALAVPVFVMQVYDRLVFHHGISTLWGLVIGVNIVLIFDWILRQTRSRIMQTVALRVDVEVGRRLYERMMALPLQTLESMPAAHWQSLFRDVDVIRNTLSGASAILMADLPFVFLYVGLIFVIAYPIAWVLVIIVPLFMLVAWRSGRVMTAANREERQSTQNRDSMIAEMISGRTTIKALALDNAMKPMWEEKNAENLENSIVRGRASDFYANWGSSLTMITTVFMTTVGAYEIINGELTMGALIASNMLSGRVLGPMNQLVGQWRTYAGFRQSVERLGQLFAVTPERQVSEVQLERPRGELSIENVSYAYGPNAAPVVDQVTLTIPVGGVHALVGRNGSGKTTLLKVMQGLYQPSEGRVLLDGADIAQFTRAELAEWMGYVPQESVLFQGTVRDNIVHRRPQSTDEEIIKAATAAGVHHFIIDLPDGYATDIGEAGRRLSGGQRQRIAIARALVGDPPVLILDEPSSSLDRQAELELRKTLQEIGEERTVIVVTHSPILLAACDHLVALDRGKVALAGPAKEILPRLFGTQPARQTGPQTAPSGGAIAAATPVPQSPTALPPRPAAAPAIDMAMRRPIQAQPAAKPAQPAATPSTDAPPRAQIAGGGPGLRTPMTSSGVVSLDPPSAPGMVKLQASAAPAHRQGPEEERPIPTVPRTVEPR